MGGLYVAIRVGSEPLSATPMTIDVARGEWRLRGDYTKSDPLGDVDRAAYNHRRLCLLIAPQDMRVLRFHPDLVRRERAPGDLRPLTLRLLADAFEVAAVVVWDGIAAGQFSLVVPM